MIAFERQYTPILALKSMFAILFWLSSVLHRFHSPWSYSPCATASTLLLDITLMHQVFIVAFPSFNPCVHHNPDDIAAGDGVITSTQFGSPKPPGMVRISVSSRSIPSTRAGHILVNAEANQVRHGISSLGSALFISPLIRIWHELDPVSAATGLTLMAPLSSSTAITGAFLPYLSNLHCALRISSDGFQWWIP
jgi:hypothetical protein